MKRLGSEIAETIALAAVVVVAVRIANEPAYVSQGLLIFRHVPVWIMSCISWQTCTKANVCFELFEDHLKAIGRPFEDFWSPSKDHWKTVYKDQLNTIYRPFEEHLKTMRRPIWRQFEDIWRSCEDPFEDHLKTIWRPFLKTICRPFQDHLQTIWRPS